MTIVVSADVAKRSRTFPNAGSGLLSRREKIQSLKVRIQICGENIVQKAINIMVGLPGSQIAIGRRDGSARAAC